MPSERYIIEFVFEFIFFYRLVIYGRFNFYVYVHKKTYKIKVVKGKSFSIISWKIFSIVLALATRLRFTAIHEIYDPMCTSPIYVWPQ